MLRSDFLTQGPLVPAFEQAIAAVLRSRARGGDEQRDGSALHAACLALELGPGDRAVDEPDHLRRKLRMRRSIAAPTSTSSISIRGTCNMSVETARGEARAADRSGTAAEDRHSGAPGGAKRLRHARALRSSPGATASGSSRTLRTPLALNSADGSRSATAETATSPFSASIRSRSSPPARAAWP